MFRSRDPLTYFLQGRIIAFVKLLWSGSVTASKESKPIAIMYGCLVGVVFIVGLSVGSWGIPMLLLLGTALVLGIRRYIQEAPIRNRRKFFKDIFVTMGFFAKGDIYPYYLSEAEVSEYTTVFSFNTFIPANSWWARKDELEMYFGASITDIKQSTKDNRVIHVHVGVAPLPTHVEWVDSYLIKRGMFNIGKTHTGITLLDIEKHPHAFIAGETGSGKSNILKCFIHQALAKKYRVVLIDFKRGVSFADFKDKITIHYEYPEVVAALHGMVEETKKRLDKFREVGVDNIADYNKLKRGYMKRTIVFIDELAELLKTRDKATANALNDSIETLTRLSRAVGIHLIMGIQRPDSTIVSGQIKNNVSFRVCGRFVDPEPSRIMLGNERASKLPNIKGRFIVKGDNLQEVQAFYFATPTQASTLSSQPPHTAPTAPHAPYEQGVAPNEGIYGNTAVSLPQTLTQAETLAETLATPQAILADLFFETRESYNQSSSHAEYLAAETISKNINPFLLAYGKSEIKYSNIHELAMGMNAIILAEAKIDPEHYAIPHLNMTFNQLLSDNNESAYVSQTRFIIAEKLKEGTLFEIPYLATLTIATDFIANYADLGGARPSLSDRLYKIFRSHEDLPPPAYLLWAALAVATEFDEDLWTDYNTRLFDLKTGKTSAQHFTSLPKQTASTPPIAIASTEAKPTANSTPESKGKVVALKEAKKPNPTTKPEKPNNPDSIDFDFSNFKK